MKRHFNLLGHRTLWFGDPIDWHLDPVRGKRAPLVPWSVLDTGDEEAVGDTRLVWELNRHQWLVRLAQAARSPAIDATPSRASARSTPGSTPILRALA